MSGGDRKKGGNVCCSVRVGDYRCVRTSLIFACFMFRFLFVRKTLLMKDGLFPLSSFHFVNGRIVWGRNIEDAKSCTSVALASPWHNDTSTHWHKHHDQPCGASKRILVTSWHMRVIRPWIRSAEGTSWRLECYSLCHFPTPEGHNSRGDDQSPASIAGLNSGEAPWRHNGAYSRSAWILMICHGHATMRLLLR